MIFPWLSGLNPVALQGTKVLEDREIRHGFGWVSEDAPPRYLSPKVVKYTGALAAPEWTDIKQGRLFSCSCYLVKGAQSEKDKFETLCHVKADVSTAPYTSSFAMGKMGYNRKYDMILLVGLTELKAQISWIDSNTVRTHPVPHIYLPHPASIRANLGDKEKVRNEVLRAPPPQAESNF